MSRVFVFLAFPLLFLCSCAAPKNFSLHATASSAHVPKIWLVSNGFHTSIALRAQDVPAEVRQMDPQAHYFVIGWGGRDFYMGRLHYVWDYAASIILPAKSTLHLIPVRTTLVRECPRAQIVEFEVDAFGLKRLRDRLTGDFKYDAAGHFITDGPGRLPNSRFVSGSETYFLPKTCNMWAASHLKTAGVPLTVCVAIDAGNLCWQGRRQGRLVLPGRHPQEVL